MSSKEYAINHIRKELNYSELQAEQICKYILGVSQQTPATFSSFLFAAVDLAKEFRVFPSEAMLMDVYRCAAPANIPMGMVVSLLVCGES